MDSSPGFASAACDSNRPVQARFRCGSVSLNLAACRDSQAHSTKGTPSHRMGAPAAWGRTVSGALSLPSRGAFHLSLTVLVRYRSWESAQPWRVVPPASDRVSRARPYSGSRIASPDPSRTGLSPAAAGLPMPFRFRVALRLRPREQALGMARPATPAQQRPVACTCAGLGSGPVSLAATPGVSVDFLSSGYLDVSVPPVASSHLMGSGAGSRA